MGVYDNIMVNNNDIKTLNTMWLQSPTDSNMVISQKPIQIKCKCPNPKHTNGCSIEPESEYCLWCAKGCVKRVQAIHVRFLK